MESAETAIEPPHDLTRDFAGWTWSLAWALVAHARTWRLDHPDGRVVFLKVRRRIPLEPTLADETARTRWARGRLLAPEVLDAGADGETEWMLTAALPGKDATHPNFKRDPAALVTLLARGLRELHETPRDECPFDSRTDTLLARARQRADAGLIDAREFHRELHGHFTVDTALAQLELLRPTTDDLVLCHGDYCLPNVMISGSTITGYIDLGALGLADRWWDLSVATWSVEWNLGVGWEDTFLREYGAPRDDRRIAFYRLLYEFL
jgi:kanamycin kinase